MRIAPDSPSLPIERPSAAAASAADGFAEALTSARNSTDPSLGAWTDKSLANQTPPAQRWGQWGAGASAEGFGPPPGPSEFSEFPVGPDAPASPLNSSGVTTTPSFTVPGYTARGTPIAPGFYNLAYYNWYLRDGGTPLPGFPLHEAGTTLTETYGSFGDGAERATSFVTAPAGDGGGTDGGGTPTTDAGGATGVLTGAIHAGAADGDPSAAAARVSATLARLEAASSGSDSAASSAPTRAAASAVVARGDGAATASAEQRDAQMQIAERDATAADASATEMDTAATLRAATRDLQTLGKTELAALLSDLLRNV